MRMSDMIEEFIKELFDDDDYIEIQRNDLAEHFNCVPSQINYVIATRFKPSQGYYVESKRGGGGHISIKKINTLNNFFIFYHLISFYIYFFIFTFFTFDQTPYFLPLTPFFRLFFL